MKLSVILSQLQSAELNQLSCVDPETGIIKPEKYPAIAEVINSGLIDLHTRFKLRLESVVVPILPDVEVYRLEAVDSKVKTRFLQMHQITDQCDRELGMNDYTSRRSVFFTSKTTMHVPKCVRTEERVTEIKVLYRAMPKLIDTAEEDMEPEFLEVDLDHAYLWALCLFVASRLHSPVGLRDSTHSINAYLGLYNAECARLEETNLELSYVATNERMHRAGWP